MKSIIMALVFIMGAVVSHAEASYTPRVDGSWFDTDCFGCPGDVVKQEVLKQQADYDEAEQAWVTDHDIESLKECVKLALFSYDKAGYFLELARLTGDSAFYQQAADAARAAIAVKDNAKWQNRKGQNVPEKSHRLGEKWLAVALKHGAK